MNENNLDAQVDAVIRRVLDGTDEHEHPSWCDWARLWLQGVDRSGDAALAHSEWAMSDGAEPQAFAAGCAVRLRFGQHEALGDDLRDYWRNNR